MSERFTHRAKQPWTFDPDRTYAQPVSSKPRGLWLSVDGDWERWLQDEDMISEEQCWGNGTREFLVNVERCLWLKSVEDIDRFQRIYVKEHAPDWSGKPDGYRIDWSPLAEVCAGIIIAPYQWKRRLEGDASTWYYGWDAGSACIWDLSVLTLCRRELTAAATSVNIPDGE